MPNESLYLIWNLSWGEFTVFWVCLELRTHKKGSNLDSKEAKHLFHQSFSTTNSEVYRQRLISKETDFMRQKWSMTKFKGNWTVFPSILKDKSFINLNKIFPTNRQFSFNSCGNYKPKCHGKIFCNKWKSFSYINFFVWVFSFFGKVGCFVFR